MKHERFIGIDLGTSNSAIAEYSDSCEILPIEQLIDQDLEATSTTLPSALYLAPKGRQAIIGRYAREQASKQPHRTVTSAKSWLCSKQISPTEASLPWGADFDGEKISPVEASAKLLEHLRTRTKFQGEAVDWQACTLTLTVPASFDESARQLTLKAAQDAGFPKVTLLEEPLAALYSWISQDENQWKQQVSHGDLVLVCDIGGGTTDFSLVAVSDQKGELELERVAVGRHLLLGGDNMDLALAYRAKWELENQQIELDQWQLSSLVYQSSKAKEELMSKPEVASIKVGIASQGSDLFGSAISVDIQSSWINDIIVEGFFPKCEISDRPQDTSDLGLAELGLQYENDPSISKHLASFLGLAAQNILSDHRLQELAGEHLSNDRQILKPTAILFNGGVFKGPLLRNRVSEIINHWLGTAPKELHGIDCDLAVARGAAYFSYLKGTSSSLRIRSGTSHSFYLGVESGLMPIPGFRQPTKGVCLVPQGTEEGSRLRLDDRLFSLKTGQDIRFKFYSTPQRAGDRLGDVVANADKELAKQFVVHAHIPETTGDETSFPVYLDAEIDEMGTMQLHMQHTQSEKSWQLEFDVRAND